MIISSMSRTYISVFPLEVTPFSKVTAYFEMTLTSVSAVSTELFYFLEFPSPLTLSGPKIFENSYQLMF
jgi:hypothetical protein